MNANNYSDLKLNNLSNILLAIFKERAISRKEISEKIGLSQSAITSLTKELLKQEFIEESIPSYNKHSGGGRPPTQLTLRNQPHTSIGVEIGHDFYKIGTIGLAGKPIRMNKYSFDTSKAPEKIIKTMINDIKEAVNKSKDGMNTLWGVGVSLPGLIDEKNNYIKVSPSISWHNINIGKYFEDTLSCPIVFENNVNLMAIGENLYGEERLMNNMAYIFIGVGVGSALILPGTGLVKGTYGGAGEIGHITIDPGGPKCNCGKNGCLESFLYEENLISAYLNEIQSKKSQKTIEELSSNKLLSLAAEKNEHATKIIKNAAEYLGIGIAGLFNIIEPKTIFFSGQRLINDPLFLEWLEYFTKKHIFSKEIVLDFKKSSLKNNQPVIGAAAEVFKQRLFNLKKFI